MHDPKTNDCGLLLLGFTVSAAHFGYQYTMISAALAFIHARKWLVELLLLAAICGAMWWACHHLIEVGVQRQKNADAVELARVVEKAREHESTIAKEASDAYEKKLAEIHASTPIGAVRLCHATHPVSASTPATGQPDDSASGREQGAVEEDTVGLSAGPDIGPALDTYGGDCAVVAAQLQALQGWVRAR